MPKNTREDYKSFIIDRIDYFVDAIMSLRDQLDPLYKSADHDPDPVRKEEVQNLFHAIPEAVIDIDAVFEGYLDVPHPSDI